ncbi:hypothetical protein FMEXI_896 [Fusarium mexicanum]|uniref:Uncharacterized protein n=1 Tax=Fusarium mexicanum TaxID=751941 RepID=A0A8H5JK64_9HYPO|nr:hypothetical protein FMEXI_896 [Fusarium mexicanum]
MPLETLPDTPRASFLDLPLEMRQQVYLQYFAVKGGYMYDAETDKLVQANRCPIDLSLRHVCRTIARETYDYPFTLNTITFATAYRRDWRKQAAMLEVITTYHFRLLGAMLDRLRHCLTPDMYKTPIQQDLRYMPVVEKMISFTVDMEIRHPEYNANCHSNDYMLDFKTGRGMKNSGGDVTRPSEHDNNVSSNRAYTYLLQQIANRNPEKFREAIDDVLPGWAKSQPNPTSDFFNLGFDFWAIPSMHQVVDLVEQLQLEERWNQLDLWRYSEDLKEGYTGTRYCYQRKQFFSAAALAIRFLKNISQIQRLLITKLILNEDRMAVGNPECHIIGLIPFTKENPKLFIKHRLNLWRNIIPKGEDITLASFPTYNESIIERWEENPGPHQVYDEWPGRMISLFIMHTRESLIEGLSPHSYTLIFDGEPELNHSTETFRYLMENKIAWITAHTDCVARGILAPPDSKSYPFQTCTSNTGSAAIQDRSSIIQCNFTLDQPWNYRQIAGDNDEKIKGWDAVDEVPRDFDIPGINDLDHDKLDVSNGMVDWLQIQGEYFEMKPRSDLPEADTKVLNRGLQE